MAKNDRLIDIYTRLMAGETIDPLEFTSKYDCSLKTITRTLDEINDFLSDYNVIEGENLSVVNITEARNERAKYKLKNAESKFLTRAEILAVCKILMDSRGLSDNEMKKLMDKLTKSIVMPEDKNFILELLQNEWFNYTEPYHGLDILDRLLEVSKAIKMRRLIKIDYMRSDGKIKERILEPLGIIFSEYYFYLAANIQNIDKDKHFQIKGDTNPTMYRIDRMHEIELMDERFRVTEDKRFKEGEYRKRIQFMFGGELKHFKLLVKDFALESVKDHLPDFIEKKINDENYNYELTGELFGDGIIFYLLGQGDGVKLIEPLDIKEKLKNKALDLLNLYS